jgi:hypothetical protein
MMEATQDFFIEISLDVDWVAREFSYADEMQAQAKEKKRKMEMIMGILVGILLVATAFTGTGAMFAGGITAALGPLLEEGAILSRFSAAAAKASRGIQTAARGLHLVEEGEQYGQGMKIALTNLNTAVASIFSGAFIGAQGLMQQYAKIKHGDDE